MKKTAIVLVLVFALASLSSCASKKGKGCGLTGDATNPIENVTDNSVA